MPTAPSVAGVRAVRVALWGGHSGVSGTREPVVLLQETGGGAFMSRGGWGRGRLARGSLPALPAERRPLARGRLRWTSAGQRSGSR